MSQNQTQTGFTLIEVMAAILLTAIVVSAATGFYISLSDAAAAATNRTREGRRALSILDRVARDLEGAFLLVKPEEMDPLEHPWIFRAEERYSTEGADRLRFIVMNHRTRREQGPFWDQAMVSYALVPGPEDGYDLLREVRPGLPAANERDGDLDEDRAAVVAENLAGFSLRFLDQDQEWVTEWDSTGLVRSSELPLVAEISVSLFAQDTLRANEGEEEPHLYTRSVLLPVRPIDLEALKANPNLGVAGSEEAQDDDTAENDDGPLDEDKDCVTVGECVAANSAQINQALADFGVGGSIADSIQGLENECVEDAGIPFASYGVNCE